MSLFTGYYFEKLRKDDFIYLKIQKCGLEKKCLDLNPLYIF